jgi:uracil-DNA glycosylase
MGGARQAPHPPAPQRDRNHFGRGFKVRDHRGRLEEITVGEWEGPVLSTVHPSSILRARDEEAREEAFAAFVADLVKAREALAA